MASTIMKVEAGTETCSVCGGGGDLYTPEEHDACSPPMQVPLRTMLLHINNNKVVWSVLFLPHYIFLQQHYGTVEWLNSWCVFDTQTPCGWWIKRLMFTVSSIHEDASLHSFNLFETVLLFAYCLLLQNHMEQKIWLKKSGARPRGLDYHYHYLQC